MYFTLISRCKDADLCGPIVLHCSNNKRTIKKAMKLCIRLVENNEMWVGYDKDKYSCFRHSLKIVKSKHLKSPIPSPTIYEHVVNCIKIKDK